ncbi:OLC1v1021336C1 [Oldenlandia corymbosa var. corymbosa]|uniref:OLC1v1021336C1 n=1 Tax=Oldenlandia corymbosa var. corymbosa TaxID=529605 RepID=A0AAV1BXW3_OLDCO|nr:OLC1v1021336C1 [Oldenlandia corymbosa var. corymbosa]
MMDKATLLAEVITHVKQMQKTADQVSDGFFIPLDSDEVRVEQLEKIPGEEASFRASICCDYRPGLLSDLRKTLVALNVSMVRSELSTLEGRLMIVFFFSANRRKDLSSTKDDEELKRSVHQALSSTVEKFTVSLDYSPRIIWPNKKRKISHLESSSSSS